MQTFKHGDKVSCRIAGNEVLDAVISIDTNGRPFICQNIMSGSDTINKFGYTFSWVLHKDFTQPKVTDLKLVEETEIVPSPRIDYCCACDAEHGYDCPKDNGKCSQCIVEGNDGICDRKDCSNYSKEETEYVYGQCSDCGHRSDVIKSYGCQCTCHKKSLLTHDPVVGDVLVRSEEDKTAELIVQEVIYVMQNGFSYEKQRLIDYGYEFSNKPPKTKVNKEEIAEKFGVDISNLEIDE